MPKELPKPGEMMFNNLDVVQGQNKRVKQVGKDYKKMLKKVSLIEDI